MDDLKLLRESRIFFISLFVLLFTLGVNSHMFPCSAVHMFARPCEGVTDSWSAPITFLNSEIHLAPRFWMRQCAHVMLTAVRANI